MIRISDEASETGLPEIVAAGPSGVRVIPPIVMASGLWKLFWVPASADTVESRPGEEERGFVARSGESGSASSEIWVMTVTCTEDTGPDWAGRMLDDCSVETAISPKALIMIAAKFGLADGGEGC